MNMNEEKVNLDERETDETEITKEDSLFKSDYTEISSNYHLINFIII